MATASKTVGLILLLAVGQYYLTTFLIWFGHWFAHIKKGPLTFIHVGGHHALYPDSQHYFSPRFRYASLKNDSAVAQVPWQIVAAVGQFLFLPHRLFLLCLAEAVLLNALFNYFHTQFHLEKSRLEKWDWFVRVRDTHKWLTTGTSITWYWTISGTRPWEPTPTRSRSRAADSPARRRSRGAKEGEMKNRNRLLAMVLLPTASVL